MLSESQLAIIEFITREVVGTRRGNSVSGRLLRAKIGGLRVQDLSGLQPVHLSSWGPPPKDEYALTFDGLLASSRAEEAMKALLAIMRTWIAKKVVEPEFRSFSWDEVKTHITPAELSNEPVIESDEKELLFYEFVINLGKLADRSSTEGNPPIWVWHIPDDIEPLMEKAGETGDLADFIAAIRKHLKPQTTPATASKLVFADDTDLPAPEDEGVSVEEAVRRVLKFLVSNRNPTDGGTSRRWFTGPQLAEAASLNPAEVNDAIEWLATRDYVKAHGGAGIDPYHFKQVQLRPEGRALHDARETETRSKGDQGWMPVRGKKDRRLGTLLEQLNDSCGLNAALQAVLRRDADEIEGAREAGLDKSVLLLCGSVLEAVLVDVLDKRRDLADPAFKHLSKRNTNKQFPDDASLPDLLSLSTSELAGGLLPLLGQAHKGVAQTVIDHRDLIHPHREVRQQQLRINEHTSEALYAFLCVVLHEVTEPARAGWVTQYEKA